MILAEIVAETVEVLRKINNCHVPSGPAGGQFCSGEGGSGGHATWSGATVDAQADKAFEKLTPSERVSVSNYTGVAYGEINQKLRDYDYEPGGYSEVGHHIKNLDRAMEVYRAPENITLHRTCGGGCFEGKIGDVVQDAGFVSTSAARGLVSSSSGAAEPVFEIRVPKGARMLPIGHKTAQPRSEQEVLLPRDSQFKLVGKNVLELIL